MILGAEILVIALFAFLAGYWIAWVRTSLQLGKDLHEAVKRIVALEQELQYENATNEYKRVHEALKREDR